MLTGEIGVAHVVIFQQPKTWIEPSKKTIRAIKSKFCREIPLYTEK